MGTTTESTAKKIIGCCEKNWDLNKSDCSGFVKAVAADLGLHLTGQANDIIANVSATWQKVTSGTSAAQEAADGKFIIGGLSDEPNGHVVVVVDGPLNRGKYPTAYWGQLGGVGKKKTTINYSWNKTDRDRVEYYKCNIDRKSNPGADGPSRIINWGFKDLERAVAKWLNL
jgi:hypothetical protein